MNQPFDDAAARDAWNRGADAWLNFVRSGADYYRTHVHGPALLDACRVRPGEDVLDVGCGEGFFSRALAERGARVTGIDVAARQIENGRRAEAVKPLGIDYVEGSATRLERMFGPNRFDLVAACMALQDISDPAACLAGCHAVLRKNGRMTFSVPHPGSDTPTREWERDAAGRKVALRIDRYFDTGPSSCQWNMDRLDYSWHTPFWRHTIEQWSAMISDSGFVITRIQEPRPDAELVAVRPDLEDCARVPYFLIFTLMRAVPNE